MCRLSIFHRRLGYHREFRNGNQFCAVLIPEQNRYSLAIVDCKKILRPSNLQGAVNIAATTAIIRAILVQSGPCPTLTLIRVLLGIRSTEPSNEMKPKLWELGKFFGGSPCLGHFFPIGKRFGQRAIFNFRQIFSHLRLSTRFPFHTRPPDLQS